MTAQTATVHTPDTIRDLLNRSNAAVERALVVLYDRQTADERDAEATRYHNSVGFNAVDAEILSSFASQVERKLARGVKLGGCLSEKQMNIARRKVTRYAKQLASAANEKAGLTPQVAKAMLKAEKKAEGAAIPLSEDEGKAIARKASELALSGRAEEAAALIEEAVEIGGTGEAYTNGILSIRDSISRWASR